MNPKHTSPPQHGSDIDLDRLLRRLGQAEPPAGLHGRVLQRLAAAQQNALSAGSPVGRPVAWRWPALASCSAGALTLLLILHARPRVKSIPEAAPQPAPLIGQSAPHPANESVPRLPLRTVHLRPALAFRSPAQVSFPAPPAPLTAEEKLLIQVAAAGKPAPKELLDPVLSAQFRAADDAEFERFIHPSTNPASKRSN